MTVKVYIWKGDYRDHSRIYDAIMGNINANVGHASLHIIDSRGKEKRIYISHRPPQTNESSTYTEYASGDPVQRSPNIDFDFECKKIRNGQPNIVIEIYGLNENKMRDFYEEYNNHKLDISKYHIQSNNCCTIVAQFIKRGLECAYESSCQSCSPLGNVSVKRKTRSCLIDILAYFFGAFFSALFLNPIVSGLVFLFFIVVWKHLAKFKFDSEIYIHNIDIYGRNKNEVKKFENFWSIETLEYFANTVKNRDITKCQK